VTDRQPTAGGLKISHGKWLLTAAGAMAGPALEGDMKEKSLKLTETERLLDQEGMRDPKDLELWGRDGWMVEFGWKLYDHLLDEPGLEDRLRKVLADASVPNELKWVGEAASERQQEKAD
jgi:hypothetical protein